MLALGLIALAPPRVAWGSRFFDFCLCTYALPAAFAVLLISLAHPGPPKGWLSQYVLGNHIVVFLGRLSWPIYLLHKAIGDIYAYTAVQHLEISELFVTSGFSIMPSPSQPFSVKIAVGNGQWLNNQHWLLKLAVFALVVGCSWLAHEYYQRAIINAALAVAKRVPMWWSPDASQSPVSSASDCGWLSQLYRKGRRYARSLFSRSRARL
jgi:peptidoglycan/LPS O-acetylase OafA/YrhL